MAGPALERSTAPPCHDASTGAENWLHLDSKDHCTRDTGILLLFYR
eukprot:CAMPEP_0116857066 /NCGR_PEP_ID=MMETSP0418-20121206/20315_1 /TAXON_ID=1158023 /ORGANISM="Astrosyne radiata, Strain 13vi08-1A" /LENGTH=45 /DNA_ID= /DNA_START= /DNA_END= /DNA_ORIENTATION=